MVNEGGMQIIREVIRGKRDENQKKMRDGEKGRVREREREKERDQTWKMESEQRGERDINRGGGLSGGGAV